MPIGTRPARILLFAAALTAPMACSRTYDLTIDNRTVRSLTLRVFSAENEGEFNQFPDRIFSLPPNREFRLNNAIVRRGARRLFEFRAPDEELVDAFILTYDEIEASGGRITVPRGLTRIPRGTPAPAGFVDSTQQERIHYIPLFPEEDTAGGRTAR